MTENKSESLTIKLHEDTIEEMNKIMMYFKDPKEKIASIIFNMAVFKREFLYEIFETDEGEGPFNPTGQQNCGGSCDELGKDSMSFSGACPSTCQTSPHFNNQQLVDDAKWAAKNNANAACKKNGGQNCNCRNGQYREMFRECDDWTNRNGVNYCMHTLTYRYGGGTCS